MDASHPTSAGRLPPDEHTFAGYLTLRVARGDSDVDDLREWVTDVVEANDFGDSFPDDPEPTLAEALAVLDEVVAEHDRLVPEPSADAVALVGVLEDLGRAGIATSFGEGWDAAEGAETGYAAARALGPGSRGYLYCTTQDLDGLVEAGLLYVGYSGLSAGDLDESAVIGRAAYDALTGAGLSVEWDGDPRGRLLVGPLVWARPSTLGPVRVGPRDGPPGRSAGATGSGRSWWRRLTGR